MVNYELEEGQIVLCTVEKIIGTTVFVSIDNNGEGTITTSEIAPGRIRNLRDYVAPGRKIVCKVLNIRDNRIQLSLRRVKQNEKKELLDKIAKEKSYLAILKTTLGEDSEKTIKKITEKYSITDFFELLKETPKLLEEYIDKKMAEKIFNILESKKEKLKEIKQIFKLSDSSSSGIKKIKNILEESCKNSKCEVTYIAAGKYRLSLVGKDFKKLKSETHKVLENIEKLAKKQNSFFEVQK